MEFCTFATIRFSEAKIKKRPCLVTMESLAYQSISQQKYDHEVSFRHESCSTRPTQSLVEPTERVRHTSYNDGTKRPNHPSLITTLDRFNPRAKMQKKWCNKDSNLDL